MLDKNSSMPLSGEDIMRQFLPTSPYVAHLGIGAGSHLDARDAKSDREFGAVGGDLLACKDDVVAPGRDIQESDFPILIDY